MNAGGVSKACKSSDVFPARGITSGKRVSNTLVTCLQVGDSLPKGGLISDSNAMTQVFAFKDLLLGEGPMSD